MVTQQEPAVTTTLQTTPAADSPKEQETTNSRPGRRFSLRGFTSLLLSLAFLSMLVSGTMLFLTPRGRTANWTDWTLVGLDKHQWGSVHVNNSIVFVAIAIVHLLLNWSVLARYIKKKTSTGLNMKKELALATVLAGVCIVGPIWNLPPFSNLMGLNEDIKDYWDENAQEAPVPHAEEFSLTELASTIELSIEDVSSALAEAGFATAGADQTLGELAEQYGVPPSALFEAIRQRHPNTRGWGRLSGGGGAGNGFGKKGRGNGGEHAGGNSELEGSHGAGPGQGRGQGQGWAAGNPSDAAAVTVAGLAQTVGLSAEEVTLALVDAGYRPESTETTLGQLGDQSGDSPQDVIHAIRDRFPDTRGWGRIGVGRGGGWR